jgi:hypothetical protein
LGFEIGICDARLDDAESIPGDAKAASVLIIKTEDATNAPRRMTERGPADIVLRISISF